jgi:elongation factor G
VLVGDIVALPASGVRTGDTLCDPHKPVILEKMEFPTRDRDCDRAETKADQEKLGVALAKLVAEDPSFRVVPIESGQTILKMGGYISTSRPTSSSAPTGRGHYRRRRSPIAKRSPVRSRRLYPQEADRRLGPVRPVKILAENAARNRLRVRQRGRRFGAEGIIPGVEKYSEPCWLRRARRLPGGRPQGVAHRRRYHEVDSSALAFEIAGPCCARRRRRRSEAFEPTVGGSVTPEDYTGSASATSTAAQPYPGPDMRGTNVINATVPLANMFMSTRCARCRRDARPSRCSSITTNMHSNVAQEVQAKYA